MNKVIFTLIVIDLIIIFIQDMKYRLIHSGLLVLLIGLSLYFWYYNIKTVAVLVYNIAFILVNLLSLKLYTIITKKEKTTDLIYGLGIGDILFFLAITPLFSTLNYIAFFISGLIFSMIIHGIVLLFIPNKLIPLAGYLSVYLILFLGFFIFTNRNNYIDLFI